MKLGLICAMEEELRSLLAVLEESERQQFGSRTYYSGTIDGVAVTLVESGIGKVQAAMTATVLIDQFHPDVVINTGSAAGLGDGLQVGEVVISSEAAFHDVDVTAFGYAPGQMANQPTRFEADPQLVAEIETAASAIGLAARRGLIVTGDEFINGQARIDRIRAIYPDVLAGEMEGAAIAQVAHEFETPFVVIRALSDVGDDNASVSFDDFVVTAGEKSAAMILQYIKTLGSRD